MIDNLPAATLRTLQNNHGEITQVYELGFPLGVIHVESNERTYYINNHINIKLLYQAPDRYERIRIVGVEVDPHSTLHSNDFDISQEDTFPSCLTKDYPAQPLIVAKDKKLRLTFTYSVIWEASEIPWTSRWDRFLVNTAPQVHWFSIISSIIIDLCLAGVVAKIMMSILHADFNKDFSKTNEETGWKLVQGDVFRPPSHPMIFSILVGSGVQVLGMCSLLLAFGVAGFLSPANRGGLATAIVVSLLHFNGVHTYTRHFLPFFSGFGGYFGTRMYNLFSGKQRKKNAVMTAVAFPGIIFAMFFFLNLFIWGEKSSGAVPFVTLLSLVLLWFGVSVPLVLVGSYLANKTREADHPVTTNQIPRQIPEQFWYMRPFFSIMVGGMLPFFVVFVELYFILTAIWVHHYYYYIFGVLFILFIILALTCVEITIVLCYFQLCSEDYRWWWRSYLSPGASAFYMFVYSIYYYFTKLEIDTFVGTLLFFGYTTILVSFFFVLTGTIGFCGCFFFLRTIYAQVKN